MWATRRTTALKPKAGPSATDQIVLGRALPSEPQVRLLALSTVVNTIGTGLFLSAGAIFLVRSAGLSPSNVGLGLTLGTLIGFGVGPVIGDLADRRGSREIIIVCMVIEAVACASLLLVHSVAVLVACAAVSAIGNAGTGSARGALLASFSGNLAGAQLRTYLRAITNVGLAVGTIGAALVLAIDTRTAYVAMILGDAVTFLLSALIIARLPHVPPTRTTALKSPAGQGSARWLALRDARYLALTATVSIASLQYWVLIYALPLWVTEHTHAPRWFAAALFFLAAVLVAAIQVPATRSIKDPPSAARLLALSGPLFLLAWIALAFASGPAPVIAAILLIVGVCIHSFAEVWQAAGAFELSFTLAHKDAQGQYQGVFGFGHNLIEAIGPFVVISLCVSWGKPGWIVLALVVTLAGVLSARVSRI